MNREFLFRGKDKETGEWIYGNLIHREYESPVEETSETYSVDYISDYALNSIEREVDSNTIGQYIRMIDTNKEKIFEGDIIESGGYKHVIQYYEKEARYKALLDGIQSSSCGIEQQWIDEFKKMVIGNIYDNPKLIKNE